MGHNVALEGKNWFTKRQISEKLTMIFEPYVHPIFRSNVWHLCGKDVDLVIDAGMGLCSLSSVLDLVPGKPIIAVATHAHVDHIGSLHEFEERAGPRIEAMGFETVEDRYTHAGMFRDLVQPVSALPVLGWKVEDYELTPAPLTRFLDEGDVIEAGTDIFKVLHLPGHSPGSIGLFNERDGTFFSGDAIYNDVIYDQLSDSNATIYVDTMKRILTLPASRVHSGHGDSFDNETMQKIARDYIASSHGDFAIS